MFKLDLSSTYKYPVEFPVVNDSGKPQTHKINLIFKRLSREALVELNRNAEAGDNRSGEQVIEADLDYLLKFVEGWDGVADQTGQPLFFSRDNLALLLNAVPSINTAITGAFFESAAGGQRRKN